MLIRYGAMVVAWLAIIGGVMGLAIGAVVAFAGELIDARATSHHLAAWGVGGMGLLIAGLLVMIVGLAQIIVGVGIWQLRGWAWVVGIFLQSATFLASLGGLLTGVFTVQSLFTLIFSGAILVYLLRPRVRKLFGLAGQTPRPAL